MHPVEECRVRQRSARPDRDLEREHRQGRQPRRTQDRLSQRADGDVDDQESDHENRASMEHGERVRAAEVE